MNKKQTNKKQKVFIHNFKFELKTMAQGVGGPTSLQVIDLLPRNVFGIRVDVRGNINFTAKQEVIYPVAGVLSIHDFKSNKQKFLRFAKHSVPQIVAMSGNRKMLAVAEKFDKYILINLFTSLK